MGRGLRAARRDGRAAPDFVPEPPMIRAQASGPASSTIVTPASHQILQVPSQELHSECRLAVFLLMNPSTAMWT